MTTEETAHLIGILEQSISSALLGKPEAVRLCIVALIGGGHVLIEDAPGVGKTALAKAVARSLGCEFKRLQFTPDLLPSDILGTSVYLPNEGHFEFRQGPVFTNVLLADEINRTTPRTQSALLEAMNEHQVTLDGVTHPLPAPFFVVATQNPFEFEGTYPLPENQLDRFMLLLDIGYPARAIEKQVLMEHRQGQPVDRLKPVVDGLQVLELQANARNVRVDDAINDYLLDIVHATRENSELSLGVSTRGVLTYYRAVQAFALVCGRDYVVPDDVKRLAVPVLAHRVLCRGMLRERQRSRAADVINRILDSTAVPR